MDNRFDITKLQIPLIQAPMAGGPSTPALAAAVSNSGGLGFLAAGYITADRLAEDIKKTRTLTASPFGVNLFVPSPSAAKPEDIAAYREALAADAQRFGVELPEPRYDDDSWDEKLSVVRQFRPAVVTFTFGAPDHADVSTLQEAGIAVGITVTTPPEANAAEASGPDFLIVQGPEAGGHRGTFNPTALPSAQPLSTLISEIRETTRVPLIAAGGVATRADVSRLLRGHGVVAVQAGTAFLRAEEAGTKPAHAAAMTDERFQVTVVTRAFSGRYARGIENEFIRTHDPHAPFGYPEVNMLTGPIRAAAAKAGDPDYLNLWAGTGFRSALHAPAAQIVASLAP